MNAKGGPATNGAAPRQHCGAKTRSGTPCTQVAGWGTQHVGVGRCKLHGGASPIKHGRRSRYTTAYRPVQQILEQLERESVEEQMDILPEARLIRALAQHFVQRHTEIVGALLDWNAEEAREAASERRQPRPQRIPEIEDAAKLLEAASRVVDRIHKQRSADAISRADLMRLMGEMARVVERHIGDGETLEKIRDDWLTIRV